VARLVFKEITGGSILESQFCRNHTAQSIKPIAPYDYILPCYGLHLIAFMVYAPIENEVSTA
jgi:hypothetical protein